jgi:hypothetical protein
MMCKVLDHSHRRFPAKIKSCQKAEEIYINSIALVTIERTDFSMDTEHGVVRGDQYALDQIHS